MKASTRGSYKKRDEKSLALPFLDANMWTMGNWIDMKEVAVRVGSTFNTIKTRHSQGTLPFPSIKDGRSVRFDEDKIEEWKEWRACLSQMDKETEDFINRVLRQPRNSTASYKVGDRNIRVTKNANGFVLE